MPTYEYRCDKCGENFDIYQTFSEDSLTTCPLVHGDEGSDACGGGVKKVFGNVGVSFKGSGFYKNDSRAADSSKKESVDASSNGSSSDGSSKKKESSSKSSDSKSSDSGSSKGSTSSGDKSSSRESKSAASSSSGSRSD